MAAALALVAVIAIACEADAPPESSGPGPSTLVGTAWSAVSVDGGPAPVPGKEPTIAFDAGTVTGDAGCNMFFGKYGYEPATGRFVFQELAMTARGCLDDRLNAFETAFSQALGSADHLAMDGQTLLMTGPAHRIVFAPRANDS